MSLSEQQPVDITFLTCDISTTGSGHDSPDEIVGCKAQSREERARKSSVDHQEKDPSLITAEQSAIYHPLPRAVPSAPPAGMSTVLKP